MFDRPTTIHQLVTRVRRHWLPLLLTGFFAAVLLAGSPAWAAPVARPLNQTVPRPTPTPVFAPIATATPVPVTAPTSTPSAPGGDPAPGSEPAEADPSDLFQELPDVQEEVAEPAPLLATVSVGTLNVRSGPGTEFGVIGSLTGNTQVTVISRNQDGTWWRICCLSGTETAGWASALLLTPSFERSQALLLLPLHSGDPSADADVRPAAAQTALAQASQPLDVGFKIDPPFVWQGITATLTISVANPNAVDAVAVELSDELPLALSLVDSQASAEGTVETIITPRGRLLLIFRWDRIPAQTGVSATITVVLAEDLDPGTVIDNLVGVRARNAPYNAGAITIGMPPLFPPAFD